MPSLAELMGGAVKSGLESAQAGVSASPGNNQKNLFDEMLKLAQFKALEEERKTKHEEKAQAQEQKAVGDYSKRIEKVNDFNQSLLDVERLTNRDGKGGILTNPNAGLKSIPVIGGKAIPAASGIKAFLDPESAEEKKALDRAMINYIQAKGGVRAVASPRAAAMERQAMGFINSGDPQLVAKGYRALAGSMQHQLQAIQAGTPRGALESAHSVMGDPLEPYKALYVDQPTRSVAGATGTPPPGPSTAATMPNSAAAAPTRTVSKKEYSPSRNATRVTYSDGTQEIVSGQQ